MSSFTVHMFRPTLLRTRTG